MDMDELSKPRRNQDDGRRQQIGVYRWFQADADEDDDSDDEYVEDFEQFGEEAKNTSDQNDDDNKMI